MASITASTMHSMKKKPGGSGGGGGGVGGKGASKSSSAPRGTAPKLQPSTLKSAATIEKLLSSKDLSGRKVAVEDIFRRVLGETTTSVKELSAPHKGSSTARDRGGAAADLAVATKELGVAFVLKECGILDEISRMLFPQGIESLFVDHASGGGSIAIEDRATASALGNEAGDGESAAGGSLKPSASAVSLTSLDVEETTVSSGGVAGTAATDSGRGKTAPPAAREGCLLFLRALCQIVGKPCEPYVVGAYLSAALDECGSNNSGVREAAQDAATALVALSNPWAFPTIVSPLLIQALRNSTEWRVKSNALERMQQCAKSVAPSQVQKLIPKLIPALTDQVWDTKAQVSKAAKSALLAVCETNTNADVKPAIPAVVNAICKPSDTNKAVSSLMGTTFVVPVDASTLAILCPVLARALKEKLAIHKRSACLVISNMSKLVETPSAVAPFGSLLMPELQKVATNVQFEEIRDEALKALANLTKALGDSYKAAAATAGTGDGDEDAADQHAKEMEEEKARVEAEQERIKKEREEEERRQQEIRAKEEAERARFKEAMDAQRQLDKVAAAEAAEKRKQGEVEREKQRLSTKGAGGKCQACGLKKCKKTCSFYKG